MKKSELIKQVAELKADIKTLIEDNDFVKVNEVKMKWSYNLAAEYSVWGGKKSKN